MLLVALTFVLQAKSEIALLHRPPKSVPAGQAFVVAGQMVGASDVEHAELRYRRKGEDAFAKVELELKEGEDYEGVIPAEDVKQGALEYYVLAFDFLGKTREVFASAKRPQRVIVEAAEAPPPLTPDPSPARGEGTVTPSPPAGEGRTEQRDVQGEGAPEPNRFVFDEHDLSSLGVLTLADLLERVPELSVSRGIDGRYHLARAGMRDDQGVLVTLDDQPLTTLTTGAPDLRFPTSTLGRVEIVLEPARAIDLGGTIATIRLTSKRALVALRALGGGYLSHTTGEPSQTIGSYDAGIVGGGGNDRVSVFARAYAHFSGGAQLTINEDAFSDGAVTAAPGLTNDRALRVLGGLTLDVKLIDSHKLAVDLDYLRSDHGGYAGVYAAYSPRGGTESNLARLRATIRGTLGPIDYQVAVGYRLWLGTISSDATPAGYTVPDRTGDGMSDRFEDGVRDRFSFVEHAIDADLSVSAKVGRLQTLGARFILAQHVLSSASFQRNGNAAGAPAPLGVNDLAQPPPSALTRSHVMVGVNDVITPARWVSFDLGLRFALMSDLGLNGRDLPALLTPAGSVTFLPVQGLELRLSYDTTLRAPTLQERFAPPPFDGLGTVSNPALRYGSTRTAAFDASYGGAAGPVRYRGELRAAYVGARGSVAPIEQLAEGDRLTNQAIDALAISAFGRVGFLTKSYVRAGVSWQRAFADVFGVSSLLTDTPQLALVLSSTVEIASWCEVMLSLTYYAERRSNARTPNEQTRTFRIPATTLVTAEVRTRSFSGVRFVAMAQNALDVARFDDPPRPDLFAGLVPREGFRLLGGIEFSLDELRAKK